MQPGESKERAHQEVLSITWKPIATVSACLQASEAGYLRAGVLLRGLGSPIRPALPGPVHRHHHQFQGKLRENSESEEPEGQQQDGGASCPEAPWGLCEHSEDTLPVTTDLSAWVVFPQGSKHLFKGNVSQDPGQSRRLRPHLGKGLWQRHRHRSESAPGLALEAEGTAA